MRKSKIRTKTIEKNLNALKNMKIILDNNSYLRMSDFCRKNKITTGVPSALVRFGIVERIASKGMHNWRWLGEEPNLDMSIKVIKYTNGVAYKSKQSKEYKTKEAKLVIPKTTKKQRVKLNKEKKEMYKKYRIVTTWMPSSGVWYSIEKHNKYFISFFNEWVKVGLVFKDLEEAKSRVLELELKDKFKSKVVL